MITASSVEYYSHDFDYSNKREIIRKIISGEIKTLLIKDSITESELEILSIICNAKGASMMTNKTDVIIENHIKGTDNITRAEKKRLLTNLANDMKEKIAYRIPAIIRAIESGDYDDIYNILGFKNNTRILNTSVKENRLSDPHYAKILTKPMRREDINKLVRVGEAAKILDISKTELVKLLKDYKIMPDYMSSKGIFFFLPESLEGWKRKQLRELSFIKTIQKSSDQKQTVLIQPEKKQTDQVQVV